MPIISMMSCNAVRDTNDIGLVSAVTQAELTELAPEVQAKAHNGEQEEVSQQSIWHSVSCSPA